MISIAFRHGPVRPAEDIPNNHRQPPYRLENIISGRVASPESGHWGSEESMDGYDAYIH